MRSRCRRAGSPQTASTRARALTSRPWLPPLRRAASTLRSSSSSSGPLAPRNLVVGAQDDDRRLCLHPELGVPEEPPRDALKGLAHGLRRVEPALLRGIVVVGSLGYPLPGARGAVALGNLQDPSREIALRQATVGIADEDCVLLLDRWRLLALSRIGLHGDVHLLDHPAQDRGIDMVLLEYFGNFVDVDFGHGGDGILGGVAPAYLCSRRFLISVNCLGDMSRRGTRRSASETSRFQSSSLGSWATQEAKCPCLRNQDRMPPWMTALTWNFPSIGSVTRSEERRVGEECRS